MSLICKPLQALLFSRPSYALPHLAGICKYGGMGIMVPIAFQRSLSSWRVTSPGNACKYGCLRGWDTASQYHTSGIPVTACIIPRSWRRFHRMCQWCLAHPLDWLHTWFSTWSRWRRSHSISTQRLVPSGNHDYIRNLEIFSMLLFWTLFSSKNPENIFHGFHKKNSNKKNKQHIYFQHWKKYDFFIEQPISIIRVIYLMCIFNIIYFTKIHDINNNTNNTAITSTMEYIF